MGVDQKLQLIRNYPSQLRTVDYVQYVSGLASVRAYHAALQPIRAGAAEAFVALPNREYCEQVCALFEGQLSNAEFHRASQATK